MGKERPTGRDLRPCDTEAALLWRLFSLMARRNVGISSLDSLDGVEGPAWRRASAASVAAEQAGTELARECPLLGDANEAIVPAPVRFLVLVPASRAPPKDWLAARCAEIKGR